MSHADAERLRLAELLVVRQGTLIQEMRREHNETVRRAEAGEKNMKKVNESRAATLEIVSTHLLDSHDKTMAAVVNSTFTTIKDPTPVKLKMYDYKKLEALLHSNEPIIPENLFPDADEN
jgi:hypothetical protein